MTSGNVTSLLALPNTSLRVLNSYFLFLLDCLGVLENKAFVSDDPQLNSGHYYNTSLQDLIKWKN